MPCSDGRGHDTYEQLQQATRAACEMMRSLTLEQLQELSKETAEWIHEHYLMDKERERVQAKNWIDEVPFP